MKIEEEKNRGKRVGEEETRRAGDELWRRGGDDEK